MYIGICTNTTTCEYIEVMKYLFNEINARLQVQSKVNEFPFNALFLVFLLFQYKHVMIEKLLQLLVSEVNAKLLKRIEL